MTGIGRESPLGGARRGDIHFVAFPDVGGHVLRGPHPAVVVRTDQLRLSTTVVVVPMTSAARSAEVEPPWLVAVSSRASGLNRDGYVKCDQPTTVRVGILGPRAGRLSPESMDAVDRALRFVLDL